MATPALPAGYQLDQAGGTPPLPSGYQLDSKAAQPPSALSRFGHDFLSGLGIGSNEDAKNFFEHPIKTAMDSLNAQGELAKKAKSAYDQGDYKSAVIHGLNYLVPFIGQQTDKAGEQIAQGDYAGAAGRTLGAAVPIIAGSPEVQGAVGDAASAAASAVKPALNKVGTAATAVGESLDPDLVGVVSPRAAHALRLANKVGKVASKLGTEAAPQAAEVEPVYPGASEPEHPGTFPGAPEPTASPEQINPSLVSPARSLPGQIGAEQIYGPRPTPAQPLPARPGLQLTGEVASQEAAAAAPPSAPTPKTSPAAVQQQLETSLGVEPVNIKPGVSMRNQAAGQGLKLPEGFTPVDSSVLKAYKYDPATQEFDAITNSGQRFRHAEVSPEQFKAFEDADSKGKAWNDLRNGAGVTPLGKVNENGVLQPRIKPRSVVTDPETGKPEFSDVLEAKQNGGQATTTPAPKAKAAAAAAGSSSEDDLTSLLQQSLDQVKAEKGGVRTTAAPADLAKRWGVDESSIEDTDRNVRGLNAQQSQAYINKLSDSYKQGRPVEPVIETRDENNNITSVDGRHRALAAKKAGIERIPVIVRRISVQ